MMEYMDLLRGVHSLLIAENHALYMHGNEACGLNSSRCRHTRSNVYYLIASIGRLLAMESRKDSDVREQRRLNYRAREDITPL